MTMMTRAPLVLGLALARTERAAGTAEAALPTARFGRAVVATTEHGTLLAEAADGPVFLVLASDASICGRDGPLRLDDIREGDLLRWQAEDRQHITMVDELWVTPRPPEGRR